MRKAGEWTEPDSSPASDRISSGAPNRRAGTVDFIFVSISSGPHPARSARPSMMLASRVVATNPLRIAAHMLSAWKGTYRDENLIDVYAEDVDFEFGKPTAIEIGGDPAGMTDSMRARLHPDPVKLIDYDAP